MPKPSGCTIASFRVVSFVLVKFHIIQQILKSPIFDVGVYNIRMLYQTKHTEAILFGEQDSINLTTPQNSPSAFESCEKPKKKEKSRRESYWTMKQQNLYLAFLKEHMPMITSPEYRKKQRIFKKISALLGTRTPIQVKSHHQKLEDKHKTIPKIISYIEKTATIYEQEESHSEQEAITQNPQIELKDASIQTESPPYQTIFFQTKMLEDYIYSEFNLDEDSLFA